MTDLDRVALAVIELSEAHDANLKVIRSLRHALMLLSWGQGLMGVALIALVGQMKGWW